MAQRGTARARTAAALEVAKGGDDDSDEEEAALKQWENLDLSALALTTAKTVVQKRPILISVWVFGLLLAAFAGGLPVGETAGEAYSIMRQHAEVIETRELGQALVQLQTEEDNYYKTRGWFGDCDENCQRARDKMHLAKGEVQRLEEQRDKVLASARQEVGIWSSFGVQDVRRSFWDAWKSGKDFASRWTMMDIFFMSVGGREESLISLVVKIVLQYVLNLTIGMIGAFFFFLHNVYCLIVSYGESALSGMAFLLLAFVAGVATVGAYLCSIYGAVVGGGLLLIRQAHLQAIANDPSRAQQMGKLHSTPWPKGRGAV